MFLATILSTSNTWHNNKSNTQKWSVITRSHSDLKTSGKRDEQLPQEIVDHLLAAGGPFVGWQSNDNQSKVLQQRLGQESGTIRWQFADSRLQSVTCRYVFGNNCRGDVLIILHVIGLLKGVVCCNPFLYHYHCICSFSVRYWHVHYCHTHKDSLNVLF